MKIMVLGNMGYVGPVVIRHLRENRENYTLAGLDAAFFAHCLTNGGDWPERDLDVQYYQDLRDPDYECLRGFDAIVLLAAISNDPIGNKFEEVTNAINFEASLKLVKAAKARGVSRVVFASSCSVYGATENGICDENSPLAPQTAYARSKIGLEKAMKPLADNNFAVTCLRFGTACGMSDRLRLDLVLNDFVATAIASGKILVLSDGSPWRPLIHVKDMARAMDWALHRDNSQPFISINTGSNKWNYQIRDLATATADVIGGVAVDINTEAQPDNRSYRVNFDRFAGLAEGYLPEVDLEQAIAELKEGLERISFKNSDFRQSAFMRLNVLNEHVRVGRMSEDLTWMTGARGGGE